MRRTLAILLAVVLFFGITVTTVSAEEEIKVFIDGVEQSYDQPPVIINGYTLVPMRAIFNELGATVTWDKYTRSVTGTKDNITILIVVDSEYANVNGESIKLPQRARIINGKTMVPLKFVSKSLGAYVDYDKATRTITILRPVETVVQEDVKTKLTTEEIAELNDDKIVLIETDTSLGSGIIIKEGLILTNYHVINDAAQISAETFYGDRFNIEGVVVYDQVADLAVLKAEKEFGITPVTLGDPNTSKKGENIFTIGNPKGLRNTLSTGIISGFHNEDGVELIQITAPITNGSSGGGLFNEYGELIGVTTAGYGEGNLNFAVSVNHIKDWLENELAQDFTELPASFIADTGTDTTTSSNEEIEAFLIENYSELQIGNVSINIVDYVVSDDDGTKIIYGDINMDEYTKYKNNYSKIEDDLEIWIDDIAYILYTKYPEDDIEFYLSVYDTVKTEPFGQFPPDSYEKDGNEWLIDHWVIWIKFNADDDYYNYNYRQ